MMKVIAYGHLAPTPVAPGDQFRLRVDGEIVCSAPFTGLQYISRWALVRMGTGIGFFLGDDTLPGELGLT